MAGGYSSLIKAKAGINVLCQWHSSARRLFVRAPDKRGVRPRLLKIAATMKGEQEAEADQHEIRNAPEPEPAIQILPVTHWTLPRPSCKAVADELARIVKAESK